MLLDFQLTAYVPLAGGALYLSFISEYGAAIVTTLAIVDEHTIN